MFSQNFTVFLVAGGVSYGLMLLIHRLALRYGVVPKQSFRRPDQQPVALLGGLGIFLACVAGNLYLQSPLLWKILLASTPMVLVGTLDDIWEVRARTKLIGQVSSVLVWIGLMTPKALFYSEMGLPPFAGAIVTGIFLMALANSYNFLDGVDGQVGSLAVIAFLGIGFAIPDFEIIGFLFAASIAGFLIVNFPPAQIYLGEVGASFLGFSAGCLATAIEPEAQPWLKFWGINFIFALAFCDILTAIFRRTLKGIGPWNPDRDHFHHKLLRIGLDTKYVLLISVTISVFSAFTGAFLLNTDQVRASAIMGISTGGLLTVIYFSILLLEKFLATRVSMFGRTIIEKYFQFDRMSLEVPADSPVVMFDFLPYYADLQQKGLKRVDDFVKSVSEVVDTLGMKTSVRLVGSYTVAVVFSSERQIISFTRARIANQFREVLLEYQVLKNTAKIPEGLYVYDQPNEEVKSLLSGQVNFIETKKSA